MTMQKLTQHGILVHMEPFVGGLRVRVLTDDVEQDAGVEIEYCVMGHRGALAFLRSSSIGDQITVVAVQRPHSREIVAYTIESALAA